MASTLAQQLGALAKQQKKPSAPGGKAPIRGKASLLFDYQAAADVDVVTIHKIGCEGLEELCRKDPRFAQFHHSLFSAATTTFSRESQTADVLAALDEQIDAFLVKLSSHFLAPPAFKALEYLIRRYRVNEFNVEALLLCVLPYHGTNEFVRVVQTLALGNATQGGWMWLTPIQTSGTALPREVLVKRCVNDAAILGFVCDGAKRLGQRKTCSRTYLSFYAVTLCEVVASAKVSESLVEKLLPYIVDGLDAAASNDYRAATLMVLAEMASRAVLSKAFLSAVTVSMVKGMEPSPEHVRTVLLVLSHLASTQPDFTELPGPALKALLSSPALIPELDALHRSGSRIQGLIKLLSDSLLKQLLSGVVASVQPLTELATAGLLQHEAQAVSAKLLTGCCASSVAAQPQPQSSKKGKKSAASAAAAASGPSEGVKEAAKQLLSALERRHPQAVDAAINAALGTTSADPAKTKQQQGDGSDDEMEDAAGGKASDAAEPTAMQRKALYEFVNEALAGTAHALCGDSGFTLSAALSAPQAGMRRTALQHADELLGASGLSEEVKAELQGSCLSSLGDEDWDVVCAALSMRHLPSLPEAALLASLQALLRRLEVTFLQPSQLADLPSSATSAAKQALLLACQLASSAAAKQGAHASAHASALLDTAVLAVLDFALAPTHAVAVAKAAVKAARTLGAATGLPDFAKALAAAVGSYQEAAEEEAEPEAKDKEWKRKARKERRLRQASALQAGVVSALISATTAQPGVVVPELVRLATVASGKGGQVTESAAGAEAQVSRHLRARHMLLLVLSGTLARLQTGPVQGTPVAKGKGKSKSSGAGAADVGGAAAVAPTAAALQGVCLAELPAVGAAAPAGAMEAWQDAATTLLASDGTPTAEHASEAAADLLPVHARLLCAALHAALRVTAEVGESAAPGGGSAASAATQLQLRENFSQLAALVPPTAFHTHMALLLRTTLPQPQQRASFLQQLYAAPSGSYTWQAQAAALIQHSALGPSTTPAASYTPAATPTKSKQSHASGAAAHEAFSLLPYLLAAASNARPEVRAAASGCLLSFGNEMEKVAFPPTAVALTLLAQALGSHHLLIGSDPEAAVRLISGWLLAASEAGATSAVGPDPSATPGKKRSKAAKAASAATPAPAAGAGSAASTTLSSLDADSRSTLAAALASTLPKLVGCTSADIMAAAAVLAAVSPFAASLAPEDQYSLLVQPISAFLQALISSGAGVDASALASVLPSLGRDLAALLARPELLSHADGGADVARALAALLPAPPALAMPLLPLRRSALQALASNAALLPALCASAPDVQLAVFRALVASAASDVCADCRRASRQALEAADVSADVLVPLLEAAMPTPASAADTAAAAEGRRKRAKQQQQQGAGTDIAAAAASAAAGAADEERLATAVMALEMLQWKAVSRGPERVVAAAQQLLQALLPHLGSIMVPHGPEAGAADEPAEESAAAAAAGAGPEEAREGQSSLAGYAAQLVMSGAEALLKAERDTGAGAGEKPSKSSSRGKSTSKAASGAAAAGAPVASALRLDLAVSVAQQAPDSALRNAALSLVATAATTMPDAVLGHVLQVLSVIHRAATVQDDEHSQQVCACTMSALVPAWLGDGRDARDLWGVVIDALPEVLAHRRLPLLAALMAAMPAGSGLPVALLLLLQKAASAAPAASAAGSSEAPGKKDDALDDWLPDLASKLAAQVDLPARVEALSVLLAQAMHSTDSRAQAPLPRMAVAFATAELKGQSVEHDEDEAAVAALHTPSEALLRAALAQLAALTAPLAQLKQQEAAAKDGNPKGTKRAAKAALEGLYALLAALQGLMSAETYLRILAAAASQPSDKLRRRALRLFGDKVRTLREELDGLAGLPAQDVQRKEVQLAAAALLPCKALADPQQASGMTPLAQQALLGAAAAAAAAFGKVQPEAVMAAVPAALAAASSPLPAVRGSALVLLSAITKAVGVRLLPQLPATVKVVLSSGTAAAAILAKSQGGPAPAAEAAPAKSGKAGKAAAGQEEAAFDEEGDRTPVEAAAVEAAAALAALSALVDSLGAFLSPYLKDMLALLLHAGLLPPYSSSSSSLVAGAPQAGGMVAAAVAAAAAVRASIPSVIPTRLLLEPLFGQLPGALGSGIASTSALLQMVTSATEAMDTKTAATYHEQIFLFLIRLLDVRSLAPPALAGHIHEAEAATIRALVALVMKLTESRFKPLFLRMVEWASTTAAAYDEGVPTGEPSSSVAVTGAAASGLGRQIALFGAATALTQRLRSVFVPYFRYLLDKVVRHLGDGSAAGGAGGQPAKKKRRASQAGLAGSAGDAAGDDSSWVLRLRVVRSLHRALLHDSVSFFDSEKLERLLHPLVAQLEAQPPAGPATTMVQQLGNDPELDSYVSPPTTGAKPEAGASPQARHEAYDAYGVATVACLVQMGVTANSDVFWKPLNHAVLMVTRSTSVRSRLLAVEVVAQLVARLREEYLVLLPETIPFIAELLEDTDAAVEARTQQLVALLEDISGEKLDQYMT